MKSLISKDLKNRKYFSLTEEKSIIFRFLKKNKKLSKFQNCNLIINNQFKNFCSRTKFNNRCILTGRGSSVSRIFSLSRIQFRYLGREGLITGLNKSSW
jgi:ribosomal protein S14